MIAPEPSARVRQEWQHRIAAEYGSAAITQHFVLWLIQVGASPDLIDDGLAIVADELAHAQLSAEVYAAAGGAAPPAIDRRNLELPRRADRPLEDDLLTAALQVFCLNETVAVPLFAHLREATTVDVARAALDLILLDEVRHRDFGWPLLAKASSESNATPANCKSATPVLPCGAAHRHQSHANPPRSR